MKLQVCIATFLVAFSGYIHHARAFQRIIGGHHESIETFPFVVFLQGKLCGGSIISPNFIVTAAHCLHDASELSIKAGTDDLRKDGVVVKVKNYVIHPKYISVAVRYDLALLELEEPLQYSSKINKINLPVYSVTVPILNGTAMGWGRTSPGGIASAYLNAVDLDILDDCKWCSSNADCFCAIGNNGNENVCKGDSGGPLINGDILYGVVSFGGSDCDQESAFVNVPLLVDWIKEVAHIS